MGLMGDYEPLVDEPSVIEPTYEKNDEDRFKCARERTFKGLHLSKVPPSPGKKKKKPASKPFTFVQLADTQLGLLSQLKDKQVTRKVATVVETITCGFVKQREIAPVAEDTRLDLTSEEAYDTEIDYARRTVKAINLMNPLPAFVVVCGDLVNTFPPTNPAKCDDAAAADMKQAKEVQDFKSVFSELHEDVPLVCICGNHDIGNRPNAYTIGLWTTRFGDDYFAFWVQRVKFLVLNSQLYKDSSGAPELASAQNDWLDRELNAAKSEGAEHIIVLSHIPPFINDPHEPDGYFPLSTRVRFSLLQRMAAHGVSHWFCGHYHRNAGGVFHDDVLHNEGERLEVVTTAAIGTNLTTDNKGDALGLSGIGQAVLSDWVSGVRIVDVDPAHGVSHRFVALQELEE